MSAEFKYFTDEAQRVLSLAKEEALRFNHNYVGTEHILLGIIGMENELATKALILQTASQKKVRSAIEFIIALGDRTVLGEPSLTPRSKKVVELARDEARRLEEALVKPEHLLLGLLREGEGIASGVLEAFDVNYEKTRVILLTLYSSGIEEVDTAIRVHKISELYGRRAAILSQLEEINQQLQILEAEDPQSNP